MTLPPLTIVPAGAGSGKTYTIQQQLGQWVVEGHVAPERIVAVTFTEAAAAELRERIRTRLLSLGRLEDALELDVPHFLEHMLYDAIPEVTEQELERRFFELGATANASTRTTDTVYETSFTSATTTARPKN